MKEIKQKKSYLNAFFNDTNTGTDIICVLTIILCLAGIISIPYGIGNLTLFLFKPYMSKNLIEFFTKVPWISGLSVLVVLFICLAIITMIYVVITDVFYSLKKDMKLASVFQYLPTTEENWDKINKTCTYPKFKDPEQIYTTILCIFLELKAGNLLNYNNLMEDPKFSFNLYNAIRSGYEYWLHLYKNATKTEMYEEKAKMYEYLIFVLKSLSQKERNDYILFKLWGKGYEMSEDTKEALKRRGIPGI